MICRTVGQAKKHPSLIPFFLFTGAGGTRAALYVLRLALFNPLLNNNNWNKPGPDGQYKFYSVNVDYSKLKKEGPDVYMKHFTMKLLRMKVFQKTFAQFST
ncbi:hypothetical protein MJG53_018237 [Ovis ammon polii x Ovis aries]|uniref:Uncharacterized protein n=1 Tax=Ovis ammon polii x Ovis aries TaxID=2918886 RepID=A0ACB9U6Q6_9CETA|nr:hypothetical protein MJG53_018237 [Ovis ammon polii x Ovis aries]